jgi:hypothetical protein
LRTIEGLGRQVAQAAGEALAGVFVGEGNALLPESGNLGLNAVAPEGDVVQSLTVLLDVAGKRGVVCRRFDELEVAAPGGEHGGLHAAGRHNALFDDRQSQRVAVEGVRALHAAHGDADVVYVQNHGWTL